MLLESVHVHMHACDHPHSEQLGFMLGIGMKEEILALKHMMKKQRKKKRPAH